MISRQQLQNDLRAAANPSRAKVAMWFFKTGPGQYAEGDQFIGVTMPKLRLIARRYRDLPLSDLAEMLDSEIHEFRMAVVVLLNDKFRCGDNRLRTDIKNLYERKMERFNNWDLVDLSAHKVYGEWFLLNDKNPMPKFRQLARSKNLWRRRIAIISTLAYIVRGRFDHTFEIAEMLLQDQHDLIHKAVGWMLREIGKRDQASEEIFLLPRYKKMPRTMLRYAIEKFPEFERRRYLKGLK
ncbi:MAG: DNA alkylation repair protein [Patescibacteria group bacterium]